MTEYKWKVGDTGKTKNGDDYKILYIDEAVMVVENKAYRNNRTFYKLNGEAYINEKNNLTPPPPKLISEHYANVYPSGTIGRMFLGKRCNYDAGYYDPIGYLHVLIYADGNCTSTFYKD